jgi:excisionase family DNA binding protein
MYLTIAETAEYLSLPVSYIEAMVHENKIRAVHDGKQYLINREQFKQHLEQMEKMRKQLAEYLSEPIPEDPDVKDED